MKRKLTVISMFLLLIGIAIANPVWNAIQDQSVVEGDTLSFNVTHSAADNATTSYTFSSNPALPFSLSVTSFNETQAEVVVTPSVSDAGSYAVTLNATDGNTTDQSTFTLTVDAQSPAVSIPTVDFGKVELNETTDLKDFTVTNTGNVNLTNIAITSGSPELTFSSVPTSLAVGASDTVQVTLTTDINDDSGTLNLGGNFTSDEINQTFGLTAEVQGKLIISDLDITVGGKKDSNLDNGDRISEEAQPGDTVKFNIEVTNRFDDDENVDIEDVEITVTIRDIDDSDDLDEEADEFDVEADEEEDVTIEFTVPDEADEDDYDVVIEVEGEDENGVRHKIEWELTLEVEKEKHKIAVKRAQLNPTSVSCNRFATLDVKVQNLGQNEEDEVVIAVQNVQLGLDIQSPVPKELDDDVDDDDSEYSKSFTIDVPEDQREGSYSVEIRTFYDFNKVSDFQRVELNVQRCDLDDDTPADDGNSGDDGDDDTVVIVQPPVAPPVDNGAPTTAVGEPSEGSFTASTGYLALIGLGYLIVVVVIVAILVNAFRRR